VPIPHFLDGPKWIVAEKKQVLLVQPPNSQVSTSKSKIITFVAGYCWLNSHPNPSVCSPSPRMACFTLQDSPAKEPRPSRTKLQGSSMADISIGQRHHLIFMDVTMKNVNIHIYIYTYVKKWGIEWGYCRIYVITLITWECSWGDLYGYKHSDNLCNLGYFMVKSCGHNCG
jgi:hypothetical protein